MLGIASHSRNRVRDYVMVELFGDWGTDGVWRVHQLVSLVQDVPVVHVCLVVPASEVRTMHSKQPCRWNVS